MAERIDVDAILRGGIRKYKDEVTCGFVACAGVSGGAPL
jgi:hypothetical protein